LFSNSITREFVINAQTSFLFVKIFAALESQIKPIITRFIPSAADENLGLLFSPANETHFKTALRKNAALTEVMLGIFLLIELFLPTRNTLLMFIWWQYLQMRYMGDKTGDLREAFRSLDEKILSILSHRLCPKILSRLYVMLTKVLADKVKPPPPHTGPPPTMSTVFSNMVSGLKPKCSIM
jgi:Transmembrane protein 33/Nucleoporin POM33